MKNLFISVLMVIVLLGLAACSQPASGQVLQSDKPRNTSPAVNEADVATLVDGNNAFAFNLYQVLRQKESNLFYSCWSFIIHLPLLNTEAYPLHCRDSPALHNKSLS